jgi:L-malate glycosyltransferase
MGEIHTMKALITTHAQMFQTPDGIVWTKSVYGYSFFERYLEVFDELRIVTRLKKIGYEEVGNKIKVSGKSIEFFPLPFYRGPWEYFVNLVKIKSKFAEAIDGCNCAILRIPDQISFQIFNKVKKEKIPCAVEVVAHSWDLYAPGNIKTVLRPLLRVLWDNYQKRTCKKADGVAYVTESYLQMRYPANIKDDNNERFETVYTSADLKESFFYKERLSNEFEKDVLSLVHVSGINNTAKGHKELLFALEAIKEEGFNVHTTFVGGGVLLDYFKELSEKLNLSEDVTFLGNISRAEEIRKLLINSDIFVFPSLTEGLPRVILEAMATGLPCVATEVGGIPELLSEKCLVKPNDVEQLKERIIALVSDNNILAEESLKNFRNAKKYSSEVVQEKRESFYKKLREYTQKV